MKKMDMLIKEIDSKVIDRLRVVGNYCKGQDCTNDCFLHNVLTWKSGYMCLLNNAALKEHLESYYNRCSFPEMIVRRYDELIDTDFIKF